MGTAGRLAVAAFLLCALVTKSRVVSWNDASRFATVEALTAHQTFALEGTSFGALTRDRYRFAGHVYSDKPPLLSLQAAAVALVIRAIGIPVNPKSAATYLIALFTIGVWYAIGVAFLYRLARLLGFEERVAVYVATAGALATPALSYAGVLVNHVPAGSATLVAVYYLVRARTGSNVHAALGGLFGAIAYAFDPACIAFLAAAALLLFKSPRSHVAAFAIAAAPVIALQLAFNDAVSGSLVPPVFNARLWLSSPFAARYGAAPFWSISAAGLFRNVTSALVGEKGLFTYMPVSVACIAGLAATWRRSDVQGVTARAIGVLLLVFFAEVVLYHDDVSVNFGERRYADICLLLCVGLGPAIAHARGLAGIALRILLCASICIAALGTVAPFAPHDRMSSLAFAAREFARLAQRAVIPAVLDVAALVALMVLLLRYWPAVSSSSARIDRAAPGDRYV